MRTVLVTGPGGGGRTTAAAAAALAAARQGRRVLLLSCDRGPGPDAVLGRTLPADGGAGGPWTPPVEAAPGMWAARVATDGHFRAVARDLQDRGASLFDLLGAAPLDADELTEVPGAEPLAVLAALRAAHADGRWDLVVADMPPVHETVRLLALPEQLRRYLRRLLPPERQAARALRPMLAQLAGVPMPAARLYETAERWQRELAAVQAVFESAATTVRLVAEPLPAAVETLRAARAGLALQGCRVDALILNRLLPDDSADPWLAGLAAEQRLAGKALREDVTADAVPVCELPHLGRSPRGTEDLTELALRAAARGGADEYGAGAAAAVRGTAPLGAGETPAGAAPDAAAGCGDGPADAARTPDGAGVPDAGTGGGGGAAAPVGGRGAGGAATQGTCDDAAAPVGGRSVPGTGASGGAGWGTGADGSTDAGAPAGVGLDAGTGASSGAAPGSGRSAPAGYDPRSGAGHGAPAGRTGSSGAGLLLGLGAAGPAGERRPDPWCVEDRLKDDGMLVWRLPLPGAERDALGLVRRGDELVVAVGSFRRVLPLPSALRRCSVAGAGLQDGALCVRFIPDPDLWPRTS
ncbi:ArsA family ATPase [Streptomyces sp. NPDC001262]|uniref:ArsA-related P-loop ATPase n=1 Tax=Streptomyces sp. NPDC001262 TaxID=3364552 RepID=UPI003677736E